MTRPRDWDRLIEEDWRDGFREDFCCVCNVADRPIYLHLDMANGALRGWLCSACIVLLERTGEDLVLLEGELADNRELYESFVDYITGRDVVYVAPGYHIHGPGEA